MKKETHFIIGIILIIIAGILHFTPYPYYLAFSIFFGIGLYPMVKYPYRLKSRLSDNYRKFG